jgi:hypothetical protein
MCSATTTAVYCTTAASAAAAAAGIDTAAASAAAAVVGVSITLRPSSQTCQARHHSVCHVRAHTAFDRQALQCQHRH